MGNRYSFNLGFDVYLFSTALSGNSNLKGENDDKERLSNRHTTGNQPGHVAQKSIYTIQQFSIFFLNCMFYQLLRVQHSCSSTQSWGSIQPSIVETRDQNSRGCPLLFSNRNLGSFCT